MRLAIILHDSKPINDNPLVVDWNYPFLPQRNDLVSSDFLVDPEIFGEGEYFDKIYSLSWHVGYVNWAKIGSELLPVINLFGE
jgi:hypothetical protein